MCTMDDMILNYKVGRETHLGRMIDSKDSVANANLLVVLKLWMSVLSEKQSLGNLGSNPCFHGNSHRADILS